MKAIALSLFTAASLAIGLVASGSTGDTPPSGPALPCLDARGCPDLEVVEADLLDQTVQQQKFKASDCEVIEGSTQAGRRRLLRFTTTYVNIGPGDLIVGAPSAHPELFEFSPCHGHYHFKEYADYRLWTPGDYAEWQLLRSSTSADTLSRDLLASAPDLADRMVRGDKQGFCMIDIVRVEPGAPGPNFTNCNSDQGISVGWADVYGKSLAGQYIDITGLPRGVYWLEVEVNAEHLLEEANYANNSAAVQVRVK